MSDNCVNMMDVMGRTTPRRASTEEEAVKAKTDGVEPITGAARPRRSDFSAGEVGAYRPGHRTMEGAIASLGLVHPNYFGKRVRPSENGRRILSHRVVFVDVSRFDGVSEHRVGLLCRTFLDLSSCLRVLPHPVLYIHLRP